MTTDDSPAGFRRYHQPRLSEDEMNDRSVQVSSLNLADASSFRTRATISLPFREEDRALSNPLPAKNLNLLIEVNSQPAPTAHDSALTELYQADNSRRAWNRNVVDDLTPWWVEL